MRRAMGFTVASAAAAIAATAVGAELAHAQATPLTTYRDKCATCHGPIEAFARRDLVLIDDVLRGKVGGQPVAAFLTKHGRLRPDEIPALVDALTKALTAEAPAAR